MWEQSLSRWLASATDEQAYRLLGVVYARIMRAFAGGTCYGVDWPTLMACEPGLGRAYKLLYADNARRLGV